MIFKSAVFQSVEARYNQWVREHYRFLLRSAWALTGSRAIAEDVVQDCFASAWKHREKLRQPELARACCFRSCAVPPFASRYLPVNQSTMTNCRSKQPLIIGLDDKLDVVNALARLAPIHREVLVLFYFDDMSTAQMAEALEIAPGTVLSRLARARDALKIVMNVPARPTTVARVTALLKTRK